MARIIMDNGKQYNVEERDLDRIMYETKSFAGVHLREGLIKLPGQNIAINPKHISSVEELES